MDYIENISLFRRQLPQASLQKLIRQTILAASSQPCFIAPGHCRSTMGSPDEDLGRPPRLGRGSW
jgi:hypothetical protein